MYLYPDDIAESLEFDKILQLCSKYCFSEMAKADLLSCRPISDKNQIATWLDEVDAVKKLGEEGKSLPIGHFEDIKDDIRLLKKIGYILEVESVLRLRIIAVVSQELLNLFKSAELVEYPLLQAFAANIIDLSELIKKIEQVFDLDGELRPDASPELLKISRTIRSKNKELDKVFDQIASGFKKQGLLTDNVESYRNGRRVLSVPVENKRKVKGIIHDESATGKTTFVEPESVIEINNTIFELDNEKRVEVRRILKGLCNDLRPFQEDLLINFQFLIRLDIIQAKAKFAIEMEANRPFISDSYGFKIKEAYNPYLLLKNKNENKETVAFDFEFHGANRLLLLSGPNAGGKSITMKAVGLIHLMLQSGFLVPVDANSKISIFHKMMADIGDQQSVDDDLSTYSSRLKNMNAFLEKADDKTIVLIDEFGSGTDPKIGGAIAEAILRKLNYNKVYGLITTHYSNLKYFAFKTKGILNGGMLFDTDNLKPSYQLKLGKPGSSFAYEVAEKTGIPKDVLRYARHKTGKNEKAIDELLINLQSQKASLDEKVEEVATRERQLDKLIKSYTQLQSELEYQRKKVKLQKRQQNLVQVGKENKELEQLMRELKKAENVAEAKKVIKEKRQDREGIVEEISQLKNEIYYRKEFQPEEFKVGGYAKMREGDTTGEILSIEKNKAELAVGNFKMKVALVDLIPTVAPIEVNHRRSVQTSVTRNASLETKLDIRGYTVTDAIDFVQELIEQSLIQNKDMVKIVHGKGTGALKKAVHKKLKEYKNIKKVWHPEEKFGGAAITYVRL